MEEIDSQKFEKAKADAELFYKNIGQVRCPYFNESVAFNARGWEHLKFKDRWKARPRHDQYIRLRLISLAPQILKDSYTLQGLYETGGFEREKRNSRWERIMRKIIYYEFVAVIKKVRVRVIVKQVENGPKFFWSIIPFWRMDNMTNKRILHSGKPEAD